MARQKKKQFCIASFLMSRHRGNPLYSAELTLRGVRVLAPARLRARYDIRINYFYKKKQFCIASFFMLRHRGNPLYCADAAWRSRACARSAKGALKYKDKLFTKEGNFVLLLFLCCGIGGTPYITLTLRGVRVLAPARLRAR